MLKGTKKKKRNISPPKTSIQELSDSRDGGQIALRGYSYQFLYSCYLILSSTDPDTSFQLEGIEDIDRIKQTDGGSDITHIQLKYSINKQDASFLSSVLKNFLEAYLIDQDRAFKLVYDFPVANGHLSKLFESNLDSKSRAYWIGVISDIKHDNPSWNWAIYDFDQFISCLSFERVGKTSLAGEIEKALIKAYDITTDNTVLFANSIKILCFEKMEQRSYITRSELDRLIQLVKIDISKGSQNPAHSWISKLDFSVPVREDGRSYFEGKKATPADIASKIPIRRHNIEKEIMDSIQENIVTVIKASSGQGKTTLALLTAYAMQSEYKPYQLMWCDDIREIGNIVQYFKARIQLGEKILILIDGLDKHLCEWNNLAQLLQSELHRHYKIIITSRESDWYHYSGDLSNIQSLKVIKPVLEEKEAQEIYNLFKKAKHVHQNIISWQKAWNMISGRQLLIEYIYLLTHGEMLSERIASQISEIGQSPTGKAKCDILRKVCFADICGIMLSINNLYLSQPETAGADFGELLKSMESEFLVHVNHESGYVEGLHPVRSKHIVDKLHEFFPIDNTALSVIKIARKSDYAILFSHLPEFNFNTDEFFSRVVEVLWDEDNYSNYITAIQGLFSGSVMNYYRSNRDAFNEANAHGGLFLISTEMCPFVQFKEFGVSADTLDNMRDIFPDNKNITFLCELRDRIPNMNLQRTYVYAFCAQIYKKLRPFNSSEINDIASYAAISEWIYSIDSEFNLSSNFSLESIWRSPDRYTIEAVSTLMYVAYCGNKEAYSVFVRHNLDHILTYLKHQTKSHNIWIDHDKNAVHVEYILRLHDIKAGNEQSVTRLKYFCRTLPIFDLYCADALKPTVNVMSAYPIPDDAHKEMPIKNIVIMFHQNLTSLWNKTIMSNYEFDTVAEWIDYWFDVRKRICLISDKCCACIYRLLGGKPLGSLAGEIDQLCKEFSITTTGEKLYPKENRPFEEKAPIPEGLGKIRDKYFQSIHNFTNQFAGFLMKDEQKQRLAMVNLITAQSSLTTMQDYFADISSEFGLQEKHLTLCTMETQSINCLMMCCSYYQTHSPNKYFDKYQIKDWYIIHCRAERKKVEDGLSQLGSKYSVRFPEQTYTIGVLRYYPIVVDDLDYASSDSLADLFLNCISFADTPFDYLVVLSANEDGVINPNALQFPRQILAETKKEIESGNTTPAEQLLPPYPVDVTSQMLDCFTDAFELPKDNPANIHTISIGDIAEELWIYSKCVELLVGPEDERYLATETQSLKDSIIEMLCVLKDNLPSEEINWLTSICKDVFSGGKFDDSSFNSVVEHFL